MAGELSQMLERLSAGVMLADANAQLRQQQLWLELMQGTPLLEGVDRQASLAIREVKLAFNLAPVRLSFWRRLWNSARRLFGLSPSAACGGVVFELSGNRDDSVEVEVVVARDPDGAWRARQTRGADDARLRGARVRELPS